MKLVKTSLGFFSLHFLTMDPFTWIFLTGALRSKCRTCVPHSEHWHWAERCLENELWGPSQAQCDWSFTDRETIQCWTMCPCNVSVEANQDLSRWSCGLTTWQRMELGQKSGLDIFWSWSSSRRLSGSDSFTATGTRGNIQTRGGAKTHISMTTMVTLSYVKFQVQCEGVSDVSRCRTCERSPLVHVYDSWTCPERYLDI